MRKFQTLATSSRATKEKDKSQLPALPGTQDVLSTCVSPAERQTSLRATSINVFRWQEGHWDPRSSTK